MGNFVKKFESFSNVEPAEVINEGLSIEEITKIVQGENLDLILATLTAAGSLPIVSSAIAGLKKWFNKASKEKLDEEMSIKEITDMVTAEQMQILAASFLSAAAIVTAPAAKAALKKVASLFTKKA